MGRGVQPSGRRRCGSRAFQFQTSRDDDGLRVGAPITHEPFEARAILCLPHIHVRVGRFPCGVGERRLIRLTRELRVIAIPIDEQDARPVRHSVNQEVAGDRANSRRCLANRRHHDRSMSNTDA